jgi:hypothetical protein
MATRYVMNEAQSGSSTDTGNDGQCANGNDDGGGCYTLRIIVLLRLTDLLSLSRGFAMSVPVQSATTRQTGMAATEAVAGIQSSSMTTPTCTVALRAQANPARAPQWRQRHGHLLPLDPFVRLFSNGCLWVPSPVLVVAAQAHTRTQSSAQCSCNTMASLHYTVVYALILGMHIRINLNRSSIL